MKHRVVTVQFSRAGERENFALDQATEYRARIDGGPPQPFRSPWSQAELEEHVETLRNVGDAKPTAEHLRELGKDIGRALFAVAGMEAKLASRGEAITMLLQLDYPELARIPWELATGNQQPYHHLLDGEVAIVRKVPAAIPDAPALWPTGRNESLRMLYVWGEAPSNDVPHAAHLEGLQEACDRYGVSLEAHEVHDVAGLTELCGDPKRQFHFVHVLAHGARAGNGEWGLRLRDDVAKGEQVARALRAGGSTPALVTVSACDSANEKDATFGSVAYELHVYGVPLVIASQFRLRKRISAGSATKVYRQLLGGGDLRQVLQGIRRQLAPRDDEAWANEVVYSRYRFEALDDLVTVARQQGALRRANSIEKRARDAKPDERPRFVEELDEETQRLRELAERQRAATASPEMLAETFGLLGSLERRKARLRAEPPDEEPEDLRAARAYYLDGLRADVNSHYCGINAVHLSLRLGDQGLADELIPVVRFAANSQTGRDFWAFATAGELEVYAADAGKAAAHYREFVAAVESDMKGDKSAICGTLSSSRRQLDEIARVFAQEPIRNATAESLAVLDAAIRRNT